jgi:hypothetical protein
MYLSKTLSKDAEVRLKCRAGSVDVFKSSNRKANLPVLWPILLLEIHAVILGVAGRFHATTTGAYLQSEQQKAYGFLQTLQQRVLADSRLAFMRPDDKGSLL